MSLTPQQHADLSDHTYDRDKVGLGRLVDQRVVINGQAYLVLQHSDNPRTGYQGTIYQHFETGSILVAHRGTEFGREALRDGIIADGGMVLARTNSQAEDAIRLTNSALDHAKRYSSQYPTSIEVTTTGHSLGGTLAQISAHHFDLRGHTFNAYGAAQLDRRIPEGGSRVTNHVMAADAVSAASAHHGRVVIYATEREIASLRLAGYHNSRVLDLLQVDRPVAAAVANGGSHSMHNFLPVDGDGRPDVSVLAEPSMRQRADANLRMIAEYRDDIATMRGFATWAGRGGPYSALRDWHEGIDATVTPGMPAAEEGEWIELPLHDTAPSMPSPPPATRSGPELGGVSLELRKLLDAAGSNDPGAWRAAVTDLQASTAGQAWAREVTRHKEHLEQQQAAAAWMEPAARQQQDPLARA